jgi:hypothetical protein
MRVMLALSSALVACNGLNVHVAIVANNRPHDGQSSGLLCPGNEYEDFMLPRKGIPSSVLALHARIF